MEITTMGERIKELRKRDGLTQEELGNKVGVSAQAVSKWECGSVPDTELIPKIADCFNVSVDMLFGREYTDFDVYDLMSKHIFEKLGEEGGEKETIRRGFENCYLTLASTWFLGNNPVQEEVNEEAVKEQMAHKYKHSKVYKDELIAFMDRSEESPFFLYMPEADGRGKKLLENTDYCSLFADFADPDFFNAIVYLHSHKLTCFTKSAFIAKLGIPEERADEVLAMLRKYWFIEVNELELDDAVIETYRGGWTSYFLMMLQTVYYFLHRPNSFFGSTTGRHTPLLKLDD